MGKGPGPSLCDSYNYNNIGSVKKALRNYFRLESKAESNYDALAILADVKSGLNMYTRGARVLTDRQQECVYHCLVQGLTESEVAAELKISQQAVHYNVVAGVKRIQRYLITGEIVTSVFSPSEESLLIKMYNEGNEPLDISRALDKSPRSVRNKLKYLKKKGKLKRRAELNEIGIRDASGSDIGTGSKE
jgi:DNA-binding CsgD family transcriptional regulator